MWNILHFDILSTVPLFSCVVASTEGATLPFSLPGLTALDWTGEGGVIGDHCGFSQSTYKEQSANGPVSDFWKVVIIPLTCCWSKLSWKNIPGYTFNFCLTKPVDMEFVLIQAHGKDCVSSLTLGRDLCSLSLHSLVTKRFLNIH